MKRYIKAYTEFEQDWDNDDLYSIIEKADIKNPIAKRGSRFSYYKGKYYDGLDLSLWDGDQEVIDSEGFTIGVESIPEGEPAHKTILKLKCVKAGEGLSVFKDSNGRIYYYRVANVNSPNRIMRALHSGNTYELSCKVIDIPEGVAANGLTYAFKCSWITNIYLNQNFKKILEEKDRADAQLMTDLYGPNRREFFKEDLLK